MGFWGVVVFQGVHFFIDIISALNEGRSPIVLTERKSHLDFLAERLRGFTRHLLVLKGGTSAKRRRETLAELEAIPENEERLVLATGRYIGEGFDDTRLDTLFLTMPASWRGTVVQYTGRLHRAHPGKSGVRIYDYVDSRSIRLPADQLIRQQHSPKASGRRVPAACSERFSQASPEPCETGYRRAFEFEINWRSHARSLLFQTLVFYRTIPRNL